MPKFDKKKQKRLKEFLYNKYIHDAKLENLMYKYGEDSIKIELCNPIFNVKIDFIFYGVELVLAIKGKECGNRETIISLTVEDDFSYLHNYIPKQNESIENHLYLVFQMFSGDELHIATKEVTVETSNLNTDKE